MAVFLGFFLPEFFRPENSAVVDNPVKSTSLQRGVFNMRIHVVVAFAAMSSIAAAETRTFICTDATGGKSIQDRPCPAGVHVEERTAKSNPVTMDQWVAGVHAKRE